MTPSPTNTRGVAAPRVPWIGRTLVATGVIHTLFGLWGMRGTVSALLAEGLFNTVGSDALRQATFWFLFTGLVLIVVGALVHWMEARHLALPRFFGWSMLGLTALGLLVMPASGFWLLLVPVAGLLRAGNGRVP